MASQYSLSHPAEERGMISSHMQSPRHPSTCIAALSERLVKLRSKPCIHRSTQREPINNNVALRLEVGRHTHTS